jgi:uncharacterized protein (DUF58 family)
MFLVRILRFLAFWIALPVAALAAAFYFEAGMLAVCFYALFLLLILSRLMTLFWLRPIACERDLSAEVVHVGDMVDVTLRIENRSPWPILWIYAVETLPEKMATEGSTRRLLFLFPRRTFLLHYTLSVSRRGCHQVGPLVLESGDVFGLFKKCRVEPRRDFITALPPYRIIEEYEVGRRRNLGDLTAKRSLFEDPTRIRGVREYQRGDALNRIHWKATARSGRLCSKVYDPVCEAGATVVLDFHRDSWSAARSTDPNKPASELAIEIACTICRYLADGGWKVGFFANGRDPLGVPGVTLAQARATDSLAEALRAARMGRRDNRLAPISIRASRAPDQFLAIHENLGRIELSDGLPIEPLLLGELAYIDREQVLVVLACSASDSFITGILRARELGYRIMVFFICNTEAHDRAFDAFVASGIEVFNMDADWRLKEIATGRRSF